MLGSSGESVTFLQDSRVNVLIQRHIQSNQTVPVNGFRINIFFQSGNHSRSNALATQNAFRTRFPDMRSYVSFDEPYFRVNVGNFRTRLEAEAALENLRAIYPQAIIVRDVLDIRDLLRMPPLPSEEEFGF